MMQDEKDLHFSLSQRCKEILVFLYYRRIEIGERFGL